MYPDGPLIVRGDFVVCAPDGEPVPTGPIVALCRCGCSALKPLCDGSHRTSPEKRRPRRPRTQWATPSRDRLWTAQLCPNLDTKTLTAA
jgi:CDGSH-type Zn-finger protein